MRFIYRTPIRASGVGPAALFQTSQACAARGLNASHPPYGAKRLQTKAVVLNIKMSARSEELNLVPIQAVWTSVLLVDASKLRFTAESGSSNVYSSRMRRAAFSIVDWSDGLANCNSMIASVIGGRLYGIAELVQSA